MIYINGRFLTQNITGVQRYAMEICKELKNIRNDIVLLSPKKIVYNSIEKDLNIIKFGIFKGHLWEQIELPIYLFFKGRKSLLINLCNTAPIFYKNKIVTIHDVAFKVFKKNFSILFRVFYNFIIPIILKTSKNIITVSEFSKKELIKYYKIQENKINVIYNAANHLQFDQKDSYQIKQQNYILTVGSLHAQKNIKIILKALPLIRKEIKIIIIGSYNKNFSKDKELFELFNSNNDRIQFLGRINDNELISYYKNAIVFIFPSLYEGFGIPPLEAQGLGVPILISNIEVFKEVYKDSALYFDPYKEEDLSEKVNLLYNNNDLRNDLIKKGYENFKKYNWKISSENLNKIIERLK